LSEKAIIPTVSSDNYRLNCWCT